MVSCIQLFSVVKKRGRRGIRRCFGKELGKCREQQSLHSQFRVQARIVLMFNFSHHPIIHVAASASSNKSKLLSVCHLLLYRRVFARGLRPSTRGVNQEMDQSVVRLPSPSKFEQVEPQMFNLADRQPKLCAIRIRTSNIQHSQYKFVCLDLKPRVITSHSLHLL